MPQTAVIWDDVFQGIQYFVVDEDWSRFDGIYINDDSADPKLAEELLAGVYVPSYERKRVDTIDLKEFVKRIRSNPEIIVIQ